MKKNILLCSLFHACQRKWESGAEREGSISAPWWTARRGACEGRGAAGADSVGPNVWGLPLLPVVASGAGQTPPCGPLGPPHGMRDSEL